MSSMPNLPRIGSSYCTPVHAARAGNGCGQDLSAYVAGSPHPSLREFFRFECTFCGHIGENGACGECGRVDHVTPASDLAVIADWLRAESDVPAALLGELLVDEVAAGHLPVATLPELAALLDAHLMIDRRAGNREAA